ncbi:unnamed protein product [Cochlearia groenlandica]
MLCTHTLTNDQRREALKCTIGLTYKDLDEFLTSKKHSSLSTLNVSQLDSDKAALYKICSWNWTHVQG